MNSLFKSDRSILEAEAAHVRRFEGRGLLRGSLSLGALSLLTGCDLTDNVPVQRLLWNMSCWNDRVQGWLFNPNRLAPTYRTRKAR